MTNSNLNSQDKNPQQSDKLPLLPPVVLIIDASDPTGGSGLFANAQAISTIGCHPAFVISALSVQDTIGMSEIHGISPNLVLRQANAILEDMPISAIKVGLVGNSDNVRILGDLFNEYHNVPLILDPTFNSKAGDELINDDILDILIEEILSQTTIVTLNIKDARRLSTIYTDKDSSDFSSDKCAQNLLDTGCEYILITDNQDKSQKVVLNLYHHKQNKILTLESTRFVGDFYGAGSTFSAALTAYMAHGIEIITAIKLTNEYTKQCLTNSLRLGMGKLVPNRMYWRDNLITLPFNPIGENINLEKKLESNYPGN